MNIRNTLSRLRNKMSPASAEELTRLEQEWPRHDAELQALIEDNMADILELFELSPQAVEHLPQDGENPAYLYIAQQHIVTNLLPRIPDLN